MTSDKKIYFKSPELYDASGDLSKRWFVVYYPEKGKRVRRYGGINRFATAAERKQAAQHIINKLSENSQEECSSPPKQMLVRLQAIKKRLAKKTWQTYHSKLKVFSEWWTDGLSPISEDHCRKFFTYLIEERELSKTSYNAYRQTLREFFYECWPHVEKNPFEVIKNFPDSKQSALYFSKAQVIKLRYELSKRDPQLWLFCQFIYYTFIRPGELRLLQVDDIILEEKRIRIRAEISKNRKLQYVAIPDAFLEEIKALQLHRYAPTDYVFSHALEPGPHCKGIRYMNRRHQEILKDLRF
ncbi:MAG: site-specific integrase, partial [Bacteroidota bacterium]